MKRVLLSGLCAMAAASAAMGEEVKATKRAAILTPIENFYGRAEIRQTSVRQTNADGGITQKVASYKLITRLGTSAYNGRLSTYVNIPLINKAQTGTFEQGQADYLMSFAAYESENFEVTPYVQGLAPFKNKRHEASLALTLDGKFAMDTSVGQVSLHGGIEPSLSTGTQTQTSKALVKRDGVLALNSAGKAETRDVPYREPESTLEYFAGASFKPAMAPKLSLTADAYFDRVYSPVYEVSLEGEKESVEKTGYKIQDKTLTDISISYKADSLTTIAALTRIRQENFRKDPLSYEQRISLIHKLF